LPEEDISADSERVLGLKHIQLTDKQMQELANDKIYFENLPELLQASADRYKEKTALYVADGVSYSYGEINAMAHGIATELYGTGLQHREKVAIISENNPHWVAAYFGILRAGGIVVPILTDFTGQEMTTILKHSEATSLFISARQLKKFPKGFPESVKYVITIEDLKIYGAEKTGELIDSGTETIQKVEMKLNTETRIKFPETRHDELAVIIYTSGTTGNSKGVMLTHDNLIFNAMHTKSIHQVVDTDVFVSVLPLAHTYECTIGMLIPVLNGASVCYIDKVPTAAYLGPLLKKVRPTTMLTVPLIIEKIYRNRVKPGLLKSPVTKALLNFAPTRKLLHRAAGKKLMDFFGGRMRFFGVGGAALAPDVEKFLLEARFPYAVGYGLTETSPMLSGFGPKDAVYRSVGLPIQGVEIKIDSPDPVTGEGEIVAKGRNIMKGYYKNEAQTAEVFTEDGFFRTGDLGIIDNKGIIYIKGRSKNMILGANGENIYPEEIESVINEQEFVAESLVMHAKGKLVALVHLNFEKVEEKFQHILSTAHDKQKDLQSKAEELIEELRSKVNLQLNKNSRIQKTILQKDPFEKTPTQKIKRFLYKD
jgi:long-chain acyl-CoA synthetase